VPATNVGLSRLLFLFLRRPLTVIMKRTMQVVHVFKQSILLRCLWSAPPILKSKSGASLGNLLTNIRLEWMSVAEQTKLLQTFQINHSQKFYSTGPKVLSLVKNHMTSHNITLWLLRGATATRPEVSYLVSLNSKKF
jgi:hypothetical protein